MEPIIVHRPDRKNFQSRGKEALLASCKYFKGEDQCPFPSRIGDNSQALWFVEKTWVEDMMSLGESAFALEIEEFDAYGAFTGIVPDGRPKTLLARIFNRYAKCSYSMKEAAAEFHTFYGLWYHPDKKVSQKPKEDALIALCKYFNGEDKCPYKDASSVEACFWNIERIAVREVSRTSSIMLSDAKEDLAHVRLPETISDTVPAPFLQVAFVLFGKQYSAPYWSSEFARDFEVFVRSGYHD